MKFDSKNDVLDYFKQMGESGSGLFPYKIENLGDEIILYIPDKQSVYLHEMGQKNDFDFVPIEKAIFENDYWQTYISNNKGVSWRKMGGK